MSMEMRRVIAGGLLSVGIGVGGGFLTYEGFSGLSEVGHMEACQNPPRISKINLCKRLGNDPSGN
ncbi:MAG TPA: hypothetical protein VJR27_01850 [Candidatus Saccharimonadales bacterium]|nr:hypothetical protein [Candidatus Saccharimonadales bacterium]